jgi:hypothetical protein
MYVCVVFEEGIVKNGYVCMQAPVLGRWPHAKCVCMYAYTVYEDSIVKYGAHACMRVPVWDEIIMQKVWVCIHLCVFACIGHCNV